MGAIGKDIEFLEGINTHKIESYKLLYQRFYKPLVLYVMDYIDDVSEAEDIVEDMVVKLWESDVQFESMQTFKAYIYTAVRNRAIDVLRHNNVISEHVASEMANSNEADIEYDYSHEETVVRFLESVDKLPGRMREVILCYMDGMSMSEIASHLGISTESVKTYRKRAFEKIRTLSGSMAL